MRRPEELCRISDCLKKIMFKNLHRVEDTNHDQTHLTLGIIRVSAGNSNSLSDRSCAAESKDEQPRSDTALGIRNSSDTRSETETLKHLMEHDGNEENEETVSGHGDGHTDKDGVEEDTTFEKGDVHRHALESLLVNRVVLLIKVRLADFGVGLGVDGSLRVLGLLDHLNHLGALSDVLLVKDDEPGGHGRVAVVFGIGVGALFLLVHLPSHGLFVCDFIVGVVAVEGVVAGVTMVLILRERSLRSLRARRRGGDCCTCGTTVRVSTSLGVEVEFDHKEQEHGGHHNDTRHSGIDIGKEFGEAGISEGSEGCGKQLETC